MFYDDIVKGHSSQDRFQNTTVIESTVNLIHDKLLYATSIISKNASFLSSHDSIIYLKCLNKRFEGLDIKISN